MLLPTVYSQLALSARKLRLVPAKSTHAVVPAKPKAVADAHIYGMLLLLVRHHVDAIDLLDGRLLQQRLRTCAQQQLSTNIDLTGA